MTDAPLPMPIKVGLETAFSECRLPFKVDVLYWDEISEGFRRLIEQGWKSIQGSATVRQAAERSPPPLNITALNFIWAFGDASTLAVDLSGSKPRREATSPPIAQRMVAERMGVSQPVIARQEKPLQPTWRQPSLSVLSRFAVRSSSRTCAVVRDELEERAVGVAEIDAGAGALGADAGDGADLDGNLVGPQVGDGLGDRARPLEAEIAAAGGDGQARVRVARDPGTMQIQLPCSKPIGPPPLEPDQFRSQDRGIECIRALPVGHHDDAVVDLYPRHGISSFL
jgi:hypothetical protein